MAETCLSPELAAIVCFALASNRLTCRHPIIIVLSSSVRGDFGLERSIQRDVISFNLNELHLSQISNLVCNGIASIRPVLIPLFV